MTSPHQGAGPATTPGAEKKGADVELDIEARVNKLLDQLENRFLSQGEIDKIQEKIAFLRTLET